MKKALFLALLCLSSFSGFSQVYLTVTNSTSFDVEFYIIGDSHTLCDYAGGLSLIDVPGGTTFNGGATLVSDPAWGFSGGSGTTKNVSYSKAHVPPTCSGGGVKFGESCSGWSTTASYFDPCAGTTINVSWSRDPITQNVTITAY
ncbi:MAG: hypothetical protein P4L41_08145 [Flavipsychrobacter sp.]|nr:hypothetical protein [Flavipsychrobacter sp.]